MVGIALYLPVSGGDHSTDHDNRQKWAGKYAYGADPELSDHQPAAGICADGDFLPGQSPESWRKSAEVDGANKVQIFFKIVAPDLTASIRLCSHHYLHPGME